jgi:hypothetical protein
LPELAKRLGGADKAIILQQIHYLSLIAKESENEYKLIDGRWWVYNTYVDWQSKYFSWLSASAVKRHILALEKSGYLETMQSVKHKSDRTKWYAINYDALEDTPPTDQNRPMVDGTKTVPCMGPKPSDGLSKSTSIEKEKDSPAPPEAQKTDTPNDCKDRFDALHYSMQGLACPDTDCIGIIEHKRTKAKGDYWQCNTCKCKYNDALIALVEDTPITTTVTSPGVLCSLCDVEIATKHRYVDGNDRPLCVICGGETEGLDYLAQKLVRDIVPDTPRIDAQDRLAFQMLSSSSRATIARLHIDSTHSIPLDNALNNAGCLRQITTAPNQEKLYALSERGALFAQQLTPEELQRARDAVEKDKQRKAKKARNGKKSDVPTEPPPDIYNVVGVICDKHYRKLFPKLGEQARTDALQVGWILHRENRELEDVLYFYDKWLPTQKFEVTPKVWLITKRLDDALAERKSVKRQEITIDVEE